MVFRGQSHLDPEGINPKERLMSFLLHLVEARWWSYAFKEWALPDGFACFLSPNSGQKEFWRSFFTVAFAVESASAAGPSGYDASVVLKEVFWWKWPLVQWLVRLLEHCRCNLVTDNGTAPSPLAQRIICLLGIWCIDLATLNVWRRPMAWVGPARNVASSLTCSVAGNFTQ